MAADSLPPCGGLVVSGVELAWAAGSVLQSVALSGGKSRVVYETDDPPFTRLAAFGGDLFVVDQSRVMRVPASGVGGGAATTLTTNPAGRVVDAIAADESGVYWTTEGGVGGMNAIRKISLSASSAASAVDLYVGEASSSSGNDLGGLALGPDDVVWTEPKRGRVVRIAKSGGEARALATGLSAPIGVAIDGAHVYVTVHGGASREGPDGRVVRIALAGGPVETLAEAQDGPRGIAVDATHVYFTNIEGGQTRRIAK